MAVAIGRRSTIRSGPWTGVFTTPDPFDAGADKLLDARNAYIPAPAEQSGTYARPGFVLGNTGEPVYENATPFKGQGVYTHVDANSDAFNFLAFGGKLFREDPATGTTIDVTPVGVAMDASTETRVFFASMGGVLCVTDGVHRPWVASDLSSAPIVGTYIDFDGMGTDWTAFGPPVVFGGSGFFILGRVNSVGARNDLAWSEPNDWTTGYQQPDFDNRWTLEQTGTTPLYALAATNIALYYFRQRSIGAISGTVGPDLATTATHDAISTNVGTQAPQTIVQFGDTIYFCDAIGRPWSFALGSAPRPIWHQLRGIVDTSEIAYPTITARTATAAFEPTLNLYCVAIWTPSPGSQASPVEWYSFDANTGTYVGRWSIGPIDPGCSVDCLGSFLDNEGRAVLVVLGSAVSGGVSGYLWTMNSLVGVPDLLTTEDGVTLTTEDGIELTIEGQPAVWTDNGEVPILSVQTDRLGYSDDLVWLFDAVTILTGSDAPIAITATTPVAANQVEGTPTPNPSADGIYRSTCGLDLQGRGVAVTVSPSTATSQWFIERVSVTGIPSAAMPDDD